MAVAVALWSAGNQTDETNGGPANVTTPAIPDNTAPVMEVLNQSKLYLK